MKFIDSLIIRNDKINRVNKNWGYELIVYNKEYCQKILAFYPKAKASFHFHNLKKESWLVVYGQFIFRTIDPVTAEQQETVIETNDCVILNNGVVHQLECISPNGGEIFEASTFHKDEDTYRIKR